MENHANVECTQERNDQPQCAELRKMQYALRAYWAGSDEGELERDVESARSYPAKFLNGHLRALLNGWYPAADVDYRKLPNEPTGMMRFLRTFQRGVAGSVLGILRESTRRAPPRTDASRPSRDEW